MMMKNPLKYLVLLLILLLPLTHKEAFSVFLPDLTYVKFVLVAIGIYGVLELIRNRKDILTDVNFLLLLGIVGFQIISLFVTKGFVSTSQIIVFQTAVLFSYIGIRKFVLKYDFINVWFGYVLSFIAIFMFLLVQMYLQTKFGKAIGGVWPVPGYTARYGSTFWDVNHFGAYLSSLWFLLLGFSFKQLKSRIYKLMNYILMGLILYSLYLTSSRSAMIGFAFGLLIFALVSWRKLFASKQLKVTVFAKVKYLIFLLPFILIIPLWILKNKLKAIFLYRGVSFFAHLFLLKIGFAVGLKNWILGVGANAFYAYFKTSEWAKAYYYIDPAAVNFKLPLHSIWLEAFTETGVFSLIFLILFFTLIIWRLITLYKKNNDYLALGFVAGIISFMVGGFMYSYKNEFYWVYLMLAMAYSFKHNKFSLTDMKRLLLTKLDLVSIGIVGTAIFGLIWPVFLLFEPLTVGELTLYGAGVQSVYTWILDLFYYIFGLYSYVGRSVSVLFYVLSIFILVSILYKKLKLKYSILIVSIAVNLYGLFGFVIQISPFWFYTFIVVTICLFISDIFKNVSFSSVFSKYINKGILLLGIFILVVLSFWSNIRFVKDNSNSDLSFLVELAYNRGFFDKSSVNYVGLNKKDKLLIDFYCRDFIVDGYSTKRINNCSFVEDVDIRKKKKEIVIWNRNSISQYELMDRELDVNNATTVNLLEDGNYSLLLLETKTR